VSSGKRVGDSIFLGRRAQRNLNRRIRKAVNQGLYSDEGCGWRPRDQKGGAGQLWELRAVGVSKKARVLETARKGFALD